MVFGGTSRRDQRDKLGYGYTVGEPAQLPDHVLELFAKLNVTLGSVDQQMRAQTQRDQQRLRDLPINYAFAKMSSPGAATTDIQDFGGPQPGRQWVVRLIAAFASPLANNASLVTWYIGQNAPQSTPSTGQLPSTMARWQFPSVPGFQSFTADVLKVQPNEHLLAGLTGIPANSNIALIAIINDQPLFAAHAAVAVE